MILTTMYETDDQTKLILFMSVETGRRCLIVIQSNLTYYKTNLTATPPHNLELFFFFFKKKTYYCYYLSPIKFFKSKTISNHSAKALPS